MPLNKGQDRIDENGEAFTPDLIVERMLDLLDVTAWDERKTFLDPACGSGHILVHFLRRKLACGHDPIRAISTIYGADIMEDNVDDARIKLWDTVAPLVNEQNIDLVFDIVCHNVFQIRDSLVFDWNNYQPYRPR